VSKSWGAAARFAVVYKDGRNWELSCLTSSKDVAATEAYFIIEQEKMFGRKTKVVVVTAENWDRGKIAPLKLSPFPLAEAKKVLSKPKENAKEEPSKSEETEMERMERMVNELLKGAE